MSAPVAKKDFGKGNKTKPEATAQSGHAPAGGYDPSIFKTKPQDEDICSVCLKVVRDAVESDHCSHMFCKDCIEAWLERNKNCPLCKEKMELSSLMKCGQIRMRLLRQPVKCIAKGCEKEMDLREYDGHVRDKCAKRTIQCAVCDASVQEDQLANHMDKSMAQHVQAVADRVKPERMCLQRIDVIEKMAKSEAKDEEIRAIQLKHASQSLPLLESEVHTWSESKEKDQALQKIARIEGEMKEKGGFEGKFSKYTTTHQFTNGAKQWNTTLYDSRDFVLSANKTVFTAARGGHFRITVKVNGGSSGNGDHIVIQLNGAPGPKAYAGINTGYYCSFHLSDIVQLLAGQTFSILQQINGNNQATANDNTLITEFIAPYEYQSKIARYTTSSQLTNGDKTWNTELSKSDYITRGGNTSTFTVVRRCHFRVTVKVNGSSSAQNDHIVLNIDGTSVAKAYAGINTGYSCSFHLSDIIALNAGQTFTIYQQINSNNFNSTNDNTLIIEPLD